MIKKSILAVGSIGIDWLELPDKTTKTYYLSILVIDTTPMAENILYIVLIIIYGLFYIYHSWETIIKLKRV